MFDLFSGTIFDIFPAMCRDEELLARGLELNDSLQSLLAKNDAIASGLPLPTTNFSPQQAEMPASSSKHTEVKESSTSDSSPRPKAIPSAPAVTMRRVQFDEDEEEEDEFAQLARRLSMTTHHSLFSLFFFSCYRVIKLHFFFLCRCFPTLCNRIQLHYSGPILIKHLTDNLHGQ